MTWILWFATSFFSAIFGFVFSRSVFRTNRRVPFRPALVVVAILIVLGLAHLVARFWDESWRFATGEGAPSIGEAIVTELAYTIFAQINMTFALLAWLVGSALGVFGNRSRPDEHNPASSNEKISP